MERLNKLIKAIQLSDPSQDANHFLGYLTPESALLNHYTAT